VSAEEHMANYQTARALLGKGNSAVTRVKERPGFQRVRERGSSAKKGAKKSAVKKRNQRSDLAAGSQRFSNSSAVLSKRSANLRILAVCCRKSGGFAGKP
jgi:hypothetical protein